VNSYGRFDENYHAESSGERLAIDSDCVEKSFFPTRGRSAATPARISVNHPISRVLTKQMSDHVPVFILARQGFSAGELESFLIVC
jgi:hypothetical protein